jgi:uncharacterized integral membrane protein
MRTVHLAIIILFVLAIIIFAAQNFGSVTVAFLGFSVSAPLAVLAVIIYVLGMATGSSLWALIRHSLHGARRPA